jgi:ribonuclease VapC
MEDMYDENGLPRLAVDSSAILAVLFREPEADPVIAALTGATAAIISTGNVLELQLVVSDSRSKTDWGPVEALLELHRVEASPFNDRQLAFARDAAVRYGKGWPRLNFGDCFAYALAKSENISLLCTGSDFAATDVAVA